MSHEICSSLQSIIGFSTLLAEDRDSNREYIQAIGQSSRHLLHVVNEILDYSKLISGKMAFREEKIEFMYFLQEIASWTKLQCHEKEGALEHGFCRN